MNNFKNRLYEIVFEADTPKGKAFDIALLIAILLSIFLVILESVKEINEKFGAIIFTLEWIITIFFTIEYTLRIFIVKKPTNYIFSFYGIIDLLQFCLLILD